MRLFRILMVLLVLAGAQSAQSALPGDAAGRQKEMLIHRQEKMALFEKAKQQRATALISRDQQVRQEMTLPPQGGVAAGPSAAVAFSEPSAAVARQRTSKTLAVVEKAEPQSEAGRVSGDRQVRQEITTLPRSRSAAADPEAVAANPAPSEPSAAVAGPHTPKWLVSIIALLCLGGFVWWVRVKTELRP